MLKIELILTNSPVNVSIAKNPSMWSYNSVLVLTESPENWDNLIDFGATQYSVPSI